MTIMQPDRTTRRQILRAILQCIRNAVRNIHHQAKELNDVEFEEACFWRYKMTVKVTLIQCKGESSIKLEQPSFSIQKNMAKIEYQPACWQMISMSKSPFFEGKE